MIMTIVAALVIGLISPLTDIRSSYAQSAEKPSPDKVLQLANDLYDLCSQLSRSRTTVETTTDKASQLANDFCSQLSRTQPSDQATRLALAPTPGQPTTLALAAPGQQPTEKTVATGSDWSFTLGYKLWLNTWQQVVPPTPSLKGSAGINLKSTEAFSVASVPSVTFRYKDLFLSTSVLYAPKYHFDSFTDAIVGFPAPVKIKISGTRTDWDVTAGYNLFPGIALLAGYKGLYQHFTIDFPQGVQNNTAQGVTYHGLSLGAAISVPIPEGGGLPPGFGVYVTGAGGPMWGNVTHPQNTDTPTAVYGTIEGGLTYRPPGWALSFLLGYKYQGLDNRVSGKDGLDATRGAILGAAYTF